MAEEEGGEEWRGEERKTPGLGQWKRKYNGAKLTNKGQSLVSLWNLYRVWNTTSLLFAYHKDTEAGLEEEGEYKYGSKHTGSHTNIQVNIGGTYERIRTVGVYI